MRDRVQRLHHQGRHLFPDDGEEAFARAGDRAGKPLALHLPGRFRRRQSAAPDRGVSRPRAFRPHLLQPGDAVGGRHPAGRGGDGLVHRGRRLCAGDVGRDHHRERAGHHLPRRPAAGEGRDRRGGDGRGSGRRGCPRAKSPASPITWPRTTIMRCRSRAASSPTSTRVRPATLCWQNRASRNTTPPNSTASYPPTSRSNTTCAK